MGACRVSMATESEVHVMAAAVFDAAGRVLMARRPDGAHQGGLWEFPGGKLELGEDRYVGLCRELHEEIGIVPTQARPLIQVRHRYADRAVLLDVWRVDAFDGEPHGREGQPLQWLAPDGLPTLAMPAADRPIVSAVRLPDRYLITGPFRDRADFEHRLEAALAGGVRLVAMRAKALAESELRTLAEAAIARCRAHGAAVLLNGPPDLAVALGADGVHLSAEGLQALRERPLPPPLWVAASCHNEAELRQAEAVGADFAVLSPVAPTATHPDATPLGWARAQALLEEVALPVYLLGGVGPEQLVQAWEAGAQGVAGIRAFWGPEPA